MYMNMKAGRAISEGRLLVLSGSSHRSQGRDIDSILVVVNWLEAFHNTVI